MRDLAAIASMLLLLTGSTSGGASEPTSTDLKVLTWNILHGATADGDLNLEAKGKYIVAQDADLVFLQELDENCERSGRVDQMTVLGKISQMEAEFGSFMPYQGGLYGLGILSALPVRDTRAFRLPEGDEPRVALLLEVEVLGHPLLVANVHFNWTKDDTSRYSQARTLLAELESSDLPSIVAGDFNDVPDSRTMQAFFEAGFRPVEEPGPTWNALAPSVDIDHILVRSGRGLRLEPLGGQVLGERELSDHRPVGGQIRVLKTRVPTPSGGVPPFLQK